ncbi:hypothetical protein IQ254_24750 [Nodosilinea sp. LEGE 07088]|uniref:hypothetical protein n=1 Tax=Nodosilinea sp. LEGE 07088 TaxID=2777968 RepID=UPI0018811F28|nr:hypothetical protein [Nodosilinea sp. LEGE 07088]MBE9140370.1 hypothetical protein [Nodosilinea sp. LEGE 07088]
MFCRPIALCNPADTGRSAIHNLHFAFKQKGKTNAIATSLSTVPSEASASGESSLPVIDHLLISIQRLAERGACGLDEATRQDLAQFARQVEKVGMSTLANAVQKLLRSSPEQTADLLKVRYLCQLYQVET